MSAKEITASDYVRCFDKLTHFLHGQGNPEEIVKEVRPYLEMNLRYRFPADLHAEPLGKMLGKIRSADSMKPLAKLTPILNDLTNINEFCTKHSHGDGALVNSERLLASELKQIVEAALEIGSGFPTLNGR